MSDPADGPVRGLSRLAALFAQELKDVTFPGVDLATLEEARREHAEVEAELAAAEAAVELARQSLGAREEAISSLLGRAMAYLRVYAAEDPALLAQLDELVPKRRATRRGRRRRDSSPDGAKAVRPADQAREVAQAG